MHRCRCRCVCAAARGSELPVPPAQRASSYSHRPPAATVPPCFGHCLWQTVRSRPHRCGSLSFVSTCWPSTPGSIRSSSTRSVHACPGRAALRCRNTHPGTKSPAAANIHVSSYEWIHHLPRSGSSPSAHLHSITFVLLSLCPSPRFPSTKTWTMKRVCLPRQKKGPQIVSHLPSLCFVSVSSDEAERFNPASAKDAVRPCLVFAVQFVESLRSWPNSSKRASISDAFFSSSPCSSTNQSEISSCGNPFPHTRPHRSYGRARSHSAHVSVLPSADRPALPVFYPVWAIASSVTATSLFCRYCIISRA